MSSIIPSAFVILLVLSIVTLTPTLVPTARGTGGSDIVIPPLPIECPPGTFESGPTDQCIPCPAGTFQPGLGAASIAECLPCPAGTFQPVIAAASIAGCLPCPAGTTSLPGSTSQNDCEPVNAVPEFGLQAVIMIAILAPLMLLLVRRAKSQS